MKSVNVSEEAGDGTPYDLCSNSGDFVRVNSAADEL